MNPALRRLVWDRAASACEYCKMPSALDLLSFGVDHIRALYHHGPTAQENLALACFHCNTFGLQLDGRRSPDAVADALI